MQHHALSQPAHTQASAAQQVTHHTLPSHNLLQGQKTVQISHNGSIYKLQATKLGKLILTK